ncbi:MAG: UPF0147 family protein [Candidatus Micrarchaeota archaeon]|nr:UPF0147 family protein [Candidatus Micrarchaeota archaeon]MCX8154702.1 UPF0147 family protein [Candidatus Micrarchaeota archaeon]
MESFKDIIDILNTLLEEKNIPKNVRISIMNAKTILTDQSKLERVRAALAIHELDKVVNDTNITQHYRLKLMNVIAVLESKTR